MADDKKKEKPAGWNFDPIEAFVILIFLLAITASIFATLRGFFTSGEATFYGFKLSSIGHFFKSILPFLKAVGFGLAGAAALGVILLNKKANSISKAAKSKLYAEEIQSSLSQTKKSGFFSSLNPFKNSKSSKSASPSGADTYGTLGASDKLNSSGSSSSSNNMIGQKTSDSPSSTASQKSPSNDLLSRWQKIVKLSESENPSDWRFAIIEADIILDELLEKLQLPGDTMGEKLKAVEKSDFITIDYAWEAHKARNMIAHEGTNFLINQREVRRIISLYEAVFKEFYLI